MGQIIYFLILLIVVVIVAAAILAVVRAALATPIFAPLGPYAGLIYALFVLLIVLVCASMFLNGWPIDFHYRGAYGR